ncbi:MAG: ECF transporter S component [Chloroflexota bacterium]|nr:ECF transporter S component [Chloroflexota bacterium]
MVQERTRKIVITGVLSAISIFLGMTRLGFIPWISGASLTIMQVPVIIGAVLEGPIVGFVIGLVFGIFSLIQAAVAPTGPADVWFTNPLLSIFPRLFIGPVSWLIYRGLKQWEIPALITAGVGGSLTNTFLVLGMIGVLGFLPWAAIPPIILANGVPEAIVSAVLVVAVVSIWKGIDRKGDKTGATF